MLLDTIGVWAWEVGIVLGLGVLCALGGILAILLRPVPRNRRRHRLCRRLVATGQLRRMT